MHKFLQNYFFILLNQLKSLRFLPFLLPLIAQESQSFSGIQKTSFKTWLKNCIIIRGNLVQRNNRSRRRSKWKGKKNNKTFHLQSYPPTCTREKEVYTHLLSTIRVNTTSRLCLFVKWTNCFHFIQFSFQLSLKATQITKKKSFKKEEGKKVEWKLLFKSSSILLSFSSLESIYIRDCVVISMKINVKT